MTYSALSIYHALQRNLHVTSIAAATKARSVRFDVAIRESAATPKARHEVVIEIERRMRDHRPENLRIAIEGKVSIPKPVVAP